MQVFEILAGEIGRSSDFAPKARDARRFNSSREADPNNRPRTVGSSSQLFICLAGRATTNFNLSRFFLGACVAPLS